MPTNFKVPAESLAETDGKGAALPGCEAQNTSLHQKKGGEERKGGAQMEINVFVACDFAQVLFADENAARQNLKLCAMYLIVNILSP